MEWIDIDNEKIKEMELYIHQLEEENVRLKNSNKALRNNNRALMQGVNKLQKHVSELKRKTNNTKHISIEERKQIAKNTNELLDHFIKLIETNDERFSFEVASGGELATMEIFDKLKEIGYVVKIEPIKYDENDNPINI